MARSQLLSKLACVAALGATVALAAVPAAEAGTPSCINRQLSNGACAAGNYCGTDPIRAPEGNAVIDIGATTLAVGGQDIDSPNRGCPSAGGAKFNPGNAYWTTGEGSHNVAYSGNGGTAFAHDVHAQGCGAGGLTYVANLNDGEFCPDYISWDPNQGGVGGNVGPGGFGFMGVSFDSPKTVESVYFARGAADGRFPTTFYIDVTSASTVDARTNDADWVEVGNYHIATGNDGWYRRRYGFTVPIDGVTGVRVRYYTTSGHGPGIDELEVYEPEVVCDATDRVYIPSLGRFAMLGCNAAADPSCNNPIAVVGDDEYWPLPDEEAGVYAC